MMGKFLIIPAVFCFCTALSFAQPARNHNLQFTHLASRWDEAMPLGNGMLGALVWGKNGRLRLSLDRADLWDERKALDLTKLNFRWVEEQVLKKDYKPVQKLGDEPYDKIVYPTKLPAAAIEFDIKDLGDARTNVLDISSALNTVTFQSKVVFKSWVHATQPQGYFEFENLKAGQMANLLPQLIVHNYNSGNSKGDNDNSHAGEGLGKLGYEKGTVTKQTNSIRYRQPTALGEYYEVLIQWQSAGSKLSGVWTISKNKPAVLSSIPELKSWSAHVNWWKTFWSKSSLQLPDSLLEKQYYLEQYKLGCVARAGAPAITLQAVWTADNGSLPPWKGDFHNDLNTQLSYWPAYTGNHLLESKTFTDWLWKIRPKNLSYTKQYFGVEGLNVPGVVTLSGDPMGGWIQYSMSPTVSAWCAQHFYWQWKYSMDRKFLTERAYPYIHAVATYLENITRLKDGVQKLPLSSSPEFNNNNITAWFADWTNFDLSLTRYLFTVADEVARASDKMEEAKHWQSILLQLPRYAINETGLSIAPGFDLTESHRHMSQYMAIYPLALLDVNRPEDKVVMENSLKRIEVQGTRAWCGYSFSWMASLYARAGKADSALKQLQIFSSNFCSPNSFHLNGDQKGGQYSSFTYRPFTLEGNFAFAQGVHELLLQSRENYVEVFPAVPESWKNVSFRNLRCEGAFLISAKKENGVPVYVKVLSEMGGTLKLRLNFDATLTRKEQKQQVKKEGSVYTITLKKGEEISFTN